MEACKINGRVGIGLTTHNRPQVFKNTIENILRWAPQGVLCIVDDASTIPVVNPLPGNIRSYRFESNVGIARAKNKALELLYNAGCEHFFLFDDDTYPIADNWWKPYVESREPHLMYIFESFANAPGPNDMIKIYQDEEISAYSHVRGCMLYYKRVVLDTVGGMDTVFGKWGNEHGDLSNRIFSAGLTRFRYMDVVNSKGLFYAADEQEHGKFVSTVPGGQRVHMLAATKPIYDAQYNVPVYREFRELTDIRVADLNKNPLFLTAYFTTLPDPQRPGHKWEFDSSVLVPYFISLAGIGNCVVLHDADPMTWNAAGGYVGGDTPDDTDGHVRWKHVKTSINPYFQRWISYYEYLIKHRDEISWVFMTDCTDVELLKMPEPERGKIYVGDEPDLIGKSQWLQYHHKHPDLVKFYTSHRQKQMVNAGILGGYIEDVLPFIRAIIDTYTRMMHESTRSRVAGPGMTDMAVFNYVAYTRFADKISHGRHVNTTFKANERNDVSWWKHK